MTTKDVIKMLPIDEKLKIQVLNTYDYMEPGQKLMISRLAWKTYFFRYEGAIEKNTELQWEKVKEGKGKLGKEFYEDVLKETNHELTLKADHSLQSTDLAAARQAMQQIVDEIRASKKPKNKTVHN
jgi:hypothetical protein